MIRRGWRLLLPLAAGLLLALSGAALAQPKAFLARVGADAFDLPEPPPSWKPESPPLSLWATTYRIYTARESQGGVPLLDQEGRPLTPPISVRDFCRGAVQGGILVVPSAGEARLYNFSAVGEEAQVDCRAVISRKAPWVEKLGRSRFGPAKAPLGVGSSGDALVPFRSIAVDKDVIPLGSTLYIPAARGARFRGVAGKELVHDGYFYAVDTGGAIRGRQIDVFLGRAQGNPFPQFIRHSPRKGHFDAVLVSDPAIVGRLKALHAPN